LTISGSLCATVARARWLGRHRNGCLRSLRRVPFAAMMTVSRGDVVLVEYPYTDRAGSKVRPCIVVQNDGDNQRLDDTIVVLMTSKTRFTPGSATELLIAARSPAGRQAGLIFDSAVQGQNLLLWTAASVAEKSASCLPKQCRMWTNAWRRLCR